MTATNTSGRSPQLTKPPDGIEQSIPVIMYWIAALIPAALIHTLFDSTVGTAVVMGVLTALLVARLWERRSAGRRAVYMKELAYRDELTGLPNRRSFVEELNFCLANPIGKDAFTVVFFLDLDKFKGINDALGHLAGDRFLLEISSRLQRSIGSECFLARFAGDEFTVLAEAVKTREEVLSLADRMMKQFMEEMEINGNKVWANTSMGIAMVRSPRPSADEILSMADAALYHAKAQGRGKYVLFEPPLVKPTSRSLSLDVDIRKAVSARQFVLHYQPIVRLSDLRITGLEALIRWDHPRYGLLAPAEFIHLAEETGVIRSLGEWVIETACERLSAWQGIYGETLTVSVNLSALEFRQRDILGQIAQSSKRAGLAPGSLQLEITETILMQDDENTLATLRDLREQGYGLVIDDFGVGYSSLSYLKRFEIDVLKLDSSFLTNIREPRSRALATGTIQLGHSLKAQVVAEGIETMEQLTFVRSAGCDHGQGFLLGRPMTEKQLLELITADGFTLTIEGVDRDAFGSHQLSPAA
jgi:diguanylate cyclase (GGDEF)-like protein